MQIKDLKNLGPTSEKMLQAAGINTIEQLQQLGPVTAYLRVKSHQIRASLNLLYAIYGALNNCHWTAIPHDEKSALLMAVDAAQDLQL